MERMIKKVGLCMAVVAILAAYVLWFPSIAYEPAGLLPDEEGEQIQLSEDIRGQEAPVIPDNENISVLDKLGDHPSLLAMGSTFQLELDISPPKETFEPSSFELKDPSEPETSEPETSEQETSELETSEPETSEPETSKPETSEQETSEQESPGQAARIITFIEAPQPIQVPVSTPEEELELPSYFIGTADEIQGVEIPLLGWECDGTYDSLIPGEYRFLPLLAEGYELLGIELPALVVTVEEPDSAPEPETVTITLSLDLPSYGQSIAPAMFSPFGVSQADGTLRSQVDNFSGVDTSLMLPSQAYDAALNWLLDSNNIPGPGGYNGKSLPFYTFSSGGLRLPKNGSSGDLLADLTPAGLSTFNDYFFRVMSAVLYDHPEIFWLDGQIQVSFSLYSTADAVYIESAELLPAVNTAAYPNAKSTYNALQSAVNGYVAELVSLSSPYAQIKKLFEKLCVDVVYDPVTLNPGQFPGHTTAWAHDVTGAMLPCVSTPPGASLPGGVKLAVCEGYAKAFKMVCDKLGIPCVLVVGESDLGDRTEPHMWNYVYLDDNWYAIDVTWGDSTANDGSVNGTNYRILYEYLLAGKNTTVIGGKTFLATHRESGQFLNVQTTPLAYPNYSSAAYSASIVKKPLTIGTVTASGSWIYGNPLSTVSLSGQMKDGGTTVSGRFEWVDGSATASNGTGTVTRNFKFYPNDDLMYEVYDSGVSGGAVTVTYGLRNIIVTPDFGQSGIYNGMATPTSVIRYMTDGILPADQNVLTGSLVLQNKNAGNQPIVKGSLGFNGDYADKYKISLATANFKVTPKPLTAGALSAPPTIGSVASPTSVSLAGSSLDSSFGVLAGDAVEVAAGTADIINPKASSSDNSYYYTITSIDGADAGNYTGLPLNGYGNNGVVVGKAPAPTSLATPTAVYYVPTSAVATPTSIKLTELSFDDMPAGAGALLDFDYVSHTYDYVIASSPAPVYNGTEKTITFNAQPSFSAGASDTIAVKVVSENYEDFNADINVIATDKERVILIATPTSVPFEKTYDGMEMDKPPVGFNDGSGEITPGPGDLIWSYSVGDNVRFVSGLPKNVGEYVIKFELKNDYDDYFGYGTIGAEIKKADATVTAEDVTVSVGDPYPAFTPSYTGLYNSDLPKIAPIFTCAVTGTDSIGSGDITLTNLAAMNSAELNYVFTEASPRGALNIINRGSGNSALDDYVTISAPHTSKNGNETWYSAAKPLKITMRPDAKDGFSRMSVEEGSGFSSPAVSYTATVETSTGAMGIKLHKGAAETDSYSLGYKLDKTPPPAPALTYAQGDNGGKIIISGVSDSRSGIDYVEVTTPGGTKIELDTPATRAAAYEIAAMESGAYTVRVYDRAGNYSSGVISPSVKVLTGVSISGGNAAHIYPVGSTADFVASATGTLVENVDFEYEWLIVGYDPVADINTGKGKNVTVSFRGLGNASLRLSAKNQTGELAHTMIDIMTEMSKPADTSSPNSGIPAINIPDPGAVLPPGVNLSDLTLSVVSLSPNDHNALWNTLNANSAFESRIRNFLNGAANSTSFGLNVRLSDSSGTIYRNVGDTTLYLPYPAGTASGWSFLAYRQTSDGGYVEVPVTVRSGWLELNTNYLGNIMLIAKSSSTSSPGPSNPSDPYDPSGSYSSSWSRSSSGNSGWNTRATSSGGWGYQVADERRDAAWAAIASQIRETPEGKGLRIILARDSDMIPREVLLAIQGRDISLNFKWPDGRSIIIYGLHLKLPEGAFFTYEMLLQLSATSSPVHSGTPSAGGGTWLENPETGGDYSITFTLPTPEVPLDATPQKESGGIAGKNLLNILPGLQEPVTAIPKTIPASGSLPIQLPVTVFFPLVLGALALAAIIFVMLRKES